MRSDPVTLDEFTEVEAELYQQGAGISIYVSSGTFDIQFYVKRLSEMMTKPRKLGSLRLARLARYLVGYTEACAQIRSSRVRRHCENPRGLRLGWQRGTPLHQRRAGIPWRTSLGFVGCTRSGASPELRRRRALRNRGWLGTRNLHEAHVRRDGTNHQHRCRDGLDGSDRRALERQDTSKFDGCGSKTPLVTKSCV